MQNLFTVRGYDTVWGLSSILRAVNVHKLARYKWLVEDMTPEPEDLFSEPGYTVSEGSKVKMYELSHTAPINCILKIDICFYTEHQ